MAIGRAGVFTVFAHKIGTNNYLSQVAVLFIFANFKMWNILFHQLFINAIYGCTNTCRYFP